MVKELTFLQLLPLLPPPTPQPLVTAEQNMANERNWLTQSWEDKIDRLLGINFVIEL